MAINWTGFSQSIAHREGNSVCPSREGGLCSLATHTLAIVVDEGIKGQARERTGGAMASRARANASFGEWLVLVVVITL